MTSIRIALARRAPQKPVLMAALVLSTLCLNAGLVAAERSARVVLLVRGDRAAEVDAAARAAVDGQGLDAVEQARVDAQIAAQGLPPGGLPTENQMRGLALMFDARAVIVIQTGTTPDGRSVATLQVVSTERQEVVSRTIESTPDQLPVQVAVAVSGLDLSLTEPATAAASPGPAPIPPPPGPATAGNGAPLYAPSVPGTAPPAASQTPEEATSAPHTGSVLGIYFPVGVIGNTELREASSSLPIVIQPDWVTQLGLGAYAGGNGRRVGGGFGFRMMWMLHGDDLGSNESNKAIDFYGYLRIRHRGEFWEAYVDLDFGNAIQIAKLDDGTSVERNRGWGFDFAVLPGIRFDIGPEAGIFLEGGFAYRFIHFDRSASFDVNTISRMFLLQTGFDFGT